MSSFELKENEVEIETGGSPLARRNLDCRSILGLLSGPVKVRHLPDLLLSFHLLL